MNPDDFRDFVNFVNSDWGASHYLNGYEASRFYNQMECEIVMESFGYLLDYRDNKYIERAKHSA